MTILGGEAGFPEKLRAALLALNLTVGWPVFKPYLGKIGRVVSTKAASTTMYIMELVAQNKPDDVRWVTGLSADRISAMCNVLSDVGWPPEHIEKKIQQLFAGEMNRRRGIAP